MSQNFYEAIDNLTLLENNLYHLEFELSRENRSYFRIARESHQILHRAMVEALRGTANLEITGRPKSKDRVVKYKKGNEPFKEIYRANVDGCKIAWRYSEPQLCEAPEMDYREPEIPPYDDYLIGFYDLLAMIQTECYMERYVYSKPIKITDSEMKALEWLHEYIRNEYEHFVPKSYSAPKRDLIYVSILCIEKGNELIYGSGNIIPSSAPENVKKLFENIKIKLNELLKETNRLIDSHVSQEPPAPDGIDSSGAQGT